VPTEPSPPTERFAPSPTGELHLGHAYSALLGYRAAQAAGGRFLLRMEDLDTSRVRPHFVEGIYADLAWLGISWELPVLFQSTRLAAYRQAMERLGAMGATYACSCTRRDIAEAIAAPQEGGAPGGPDGPVYPGTCRGRAVRGIGQAAIRLDMARAIELLGGPAAVSQLSFTENGDGSDGELGDIRLDATALIERTGDVVLARKDGVPAYHLAVVVDDAFQGVTCVTRGCDLLPVTPIHRVLQALLRLPVPVYRHHSLIRDAAGGRLAKRDHAHALAKLREAGCTAAEVRLRLGFR